MKHILLLAIIVCGLATTIPQTVAQPLVQTESITLVETPTKQSLKEFLTKQQFTEDFRVIIPVVVLILIDTIIMLLIQLL